LSERPDSKKKDLLRNHMDVIAGEIAGYFGGKLLDVFYEQFRQKVIGRWMHWRAREFFTAFLTSVGDPTTSPEEIESKLTSILEDENRCELLFESYRRISLSRSRIIGPRSVGLLTATICSESRFATEAEDDWFQIYESCSDKELKEVCKFYAEAFEKACSNSREYKIVEDRLEILWTEEDSQLLGKVSRTDFNLTDALRRVYKFEFISDRSTNSFLQSEGI
jgi:hypothetical protein